MRKVVNIGIIGLGTIGRGVYDAVVSGSKLIAKRTGVVLKVKGVCDTNKKVLASIKTSKGLVKTRSTADLINDEKIDIIVELIGGVNPAKEIILNALKAKKHVVTANKALLSEYWSELFAAAFRHRMFINFEASVGGGIPIIKVLRESFVANEIDTIYGILNGTTNFILTEMSKKGVSFHNALKKTQEKGIAERNPELDISGKDSAHKLAILSLLAFGISISPRDVYTEGISNIQPQDIINASKWGYSVKLLAIAKSDSKGSLQLRVHPTLLKLDHLLSNVNGADNAIFIKGSLVGESLLFGKGAGRRPTSSSVMSDIIDIAKHIAFCKRENTFPYNLEYAKTTRGISRMEDLSIPFYLRFSVIDRPGVLAGISSILAKNNISIATVSQEERNVGEIVPVVIVTHNAKEGNMRKAISKIDKLSCVKNKTVVIRIEE